MKRRRAFGPPRPGRKAVCALLAATLLGASAARAQPKGAGQADALFREAKQLIDQRRFAEACPKLEESQRLDPAGGTALTLALCHQAEGRLATALSDFGTALTFAERDGRADRVRVARAAMAKLEPLVSRLTVRLDPETQRIPDLRVQRDGQDIEPSAFGVAVPVDGGTHTVVVSAPGHRVLEVRVEVAEQKDARVVDVPRLEALPPPATTPLAPEKPRQEPAAAPSTPAPETSSSLRTGLTIASFGVALAGAAATTFFALQARAADEDAAARCPRSPCADPVGVELNEDARRDAWIATAAAGVAVAGAALGVVLLLTRPNAAPTSTARSPSWHGRAPLFRLAF